MASVGRSTHRDGHDGRPPITLFGRDRELRIIEEILTSIPTGGQALLLYGEAGIGKSALLSAAGRVARERGFQVLSTAGAQAEVHLPFAALYQLLRPVLDRAGSLPEPQRAALMAVFGMSRQAAPEFFFVALAALELLAETAERAPLLILVEDAHWLDAPTLDVLKFVARRLDSEPVLLLAAARSGADQLDSGFPEMRIDVLGEPAAQKLLAAHAPRLASHLRDQVLSQAAGNPLALIELPATTAAPGGPGPDQTHVSTRLETAFAGRARDLPLLTRDLLLIAVTGDGAANRAEILLATAVFTGRGAVGIEAVEPAVDAGLIQLTGAEMVFRHPLVRSAISRTVSPGRRRAAHCAWAKTLHDEPDRAVWHQASAVDRPDENIASALEKTATHAQHRGAISLAATAMERAAQLTVTANTRSDRLMGAAELAFDIGRHDIVSRILSRPEQLELAPHSSQRIAYLRETLDNGAAPRGEAILDLLDRAGEAFADGETNLGMQLLLSAARRCWWKDPGPRIRRAVIAAAQNLPVPDDDPRLLVILALPDPHGQGTRLRQRLSEASPAATSPVAAFLYGFCAYIVGDFPTGLDILEPTVGRLRSEGRLSVLAQALSIKAVMDFICGNWSTARRDADEAVRLSTETTQPPWIATSMIVAAMISGARGEETVAQLLRDVEDLRERPDPLVRSASIGAAVKTARAITDLARNRPGSAFDHLSYATDASDPLRHHEYAARAMGFLAEAALFSGRADEARVALGLLERTDPELTGSPYARISVAYARAVLADDAHAERFFRDALADPELPRWPFPLARLRLAYGSWLRRRRRSVEARDLLRAARDTFDTLGGRHWAERARQELAAAGERSDRPAPGVQEQLTPQELHIAQMAAEGLSNREIGQRLYLSHRTVGSHLYRIFPKLGITSRTQLREVLAG